MEHRATRRPGGGRMPQQQTQRQPAHQQYEQRDSDERTHPCRPARSAADEVLQRAQPRLAEVGRSAWPVLRV